MFPMGFFFDPTFILVIIGMIISMIASSYVNRTFERYDAVNSKHQVTGTDAARYILRNQNIDDVGVQQISGNLTDNYNSGNKTLSLSQATAQSTSVAAIGVAAHECGHAVQDAQGYFPLRLRTAIVPIANFGTNLSIPLLIVGILISGSSGQMIINIGLLAFSLAFIFQLVTLPVEFNASRRALQILSEGGLLTNEEVPQARKVLTAAALTYVAAAVSVLLQLLRLFLLFGGGRRR
ncbi:peptidase [Tetragenococcus halophilus subsp. flandriensis]|uniref:zinc metallopeptidase n=1 Tax=Tetragenococcus halophilus TaxID=51669 RepID=UPI0023E9270A|nr:zinc metallopeptidase [Tetragenococcus halophilus]GMA07158.1 peptidase [Tetragenococcus halophilus subsp. flandriensis]